MSDTDYKLWHRLDTPHLQKVSPLSQVKASGKPCTWPAPSQTPNHLHHITSTTEIAQKSPKYFNQIPVSEPKASSPCYKQSHLMDPILSQLNLVPTFTFHFSGPIWNLSSHLHYGKPNNLICWGFPTKTLHIPVFFISPFACFMSQTQTVFQTLVFHAGCIISILFFTDSPSSCFMGRAACNGAQPSAWSFRVSSSSLSESFGGL